MCQNSLDPNQAPHFVGPVLGSNCLQMLPADDKNTHTSRYKECSGSVVECLTQDLGAPGSSLTGVTGLWSLSKTHLS